jgi:hypothetical protein
LVTEDATPRVRIDTSPAKGAVFPNPRSRCFGHVFKRTILIILKTWEWVILGSELCG